jgi:hypothetical protein
LPFLSKKEMVMSVYPKLLFLVFVFVSSAFSTMAQTQCSGGTPSFNVNLSSKSDSVWLSSSVSRNGTCCSGGNNCVEFIVTLSPNAEAIVLEIASGAKPSGALTYTVNCGAPTSIGQKFCVTGQGPHSITFCKNGGNTNVYRIRSIPRPMVSANFTTRIGCNSLISASGFQESTITWRAITGGATYQSTISCLSGCNSTTIITPTNPPAFIDYEVSGTPTGACSGVFARDTVRVSFVGSITSSISPSNNIVLCKGTTSTTLTANVVGGNPPYTYAWSNGATTQSITVGAGTYSVNISDATSCPNSSASVTVSVDNDNSVNAGIDRTICAHEFPIVLNASSPQGGTWLGGNGTFNPNRTTLNATYTPTNAEVVAGSLMLIMQGNACVHCPSIKDTVNFTLKSSPSPSISGLSSVCGVLNQTEIYTVENVVNDGYQWICNGGQIQTSTNQNTITIRWNAYGTYQLQLTQTRPNSCQVLVSKTIYVSQTPITPTIHRD